jgi:inner membrane protein
MGNSKRSFWWKFAIFPSVIYLFYCSFNKLNIDREIRNSFAEQNIKAENYLTTPTPLNNWLWYIVAKEKAGFFIGYRSVFDRNKNVHYTYFPQNDHLLDTLKNHEEVQHLMRFSQGFYTVENWGDTLVFNDLRFGQMVGWHDPKEQFVFHYFLQHAEDAM